MIRAGQPHLGNPTLAQPAHTLPAAAVAEDVRIADERTDHRRPVGWVNRLGHGFSVFTRRLDTETAQLSVDKGACEQPGRPGVPPLFRVRIGLLHLGHRLISITAGEQAPCQPVADVGNPSVLLLQLARLLEEVQTA